MEDVVKQSRNSSSVPPSLGQGSKGDGRVSSTASSEANPKAKRHDRAGTYQHKSRSTFYYLTLVTFTITVGLASNLLLIRLWNQHSYRWQDSAKLHERVEIFNVDLDPSIPGDKIAVNDNVVPGFNFPNGFSGHVGIINGDADQEHDAVIKVRLLSASADTLDRVIATKFKFQANLHQIDIRSQEEGWWEWATDSGRFLSLWVYVAVKPDGKLPCELRINTETSDILVGHGTKLEADNLDLSSRTGSIASHTKDLNILRIDVSTRAGHISGDWSSSLGLFLWSGNGNTDVQVSKTSLFMARSHDGNISVAMHNTTAEDAPDEVDVHSSGHGSVSVFAMQKRRTSLSTVDGEISARIQVVPYPSVRSQLTTSTSHGRTNVTVLDFTSDDLLADKDAWRPFPITSSEHRSLTSSINVDYPRLWDCEGSAKSDKGVVVVESEILKPNNTGERIEWNATSDGEVGRMDVSTERGNITVHL